jgi:two-component system, cell cycle response regulator DivK
MGETILIVEDNWLNQKLFQDLITAEGYRSICAASGSEAICLAERLLPDLAIVDLYMPDIAGLDVVKAMRNDAHLRNIPVLATSAFQRSVSAAWLLRHQCDGFIAKPLVARRFCHEINRLLRRVAMTKRDTLPRHMQPSLQHAVQEPEVAELRRSR